MILAKAGGGGQVCHCGTTCPPIELLNLSTPGMSLENGFMNLMGFTNKTLGFDTEEAQQDTSGWTFWFYRVGPNFGETLHSQEVSVRRI